MSISKVLLDADRLASFSPLNDTRFLTTPQYPFQHIATDYLSLAGQNFCLVVDRFSNWLMIYRGKGGSSNLIPLLGEFFHSFGIPESLTSDVYIADDFLKKLGVTLRISSVGFQPESREICSSSKTSSSRCSKTHG